MAEKDSVFLKMLSDQKDPRPHLRSAADAARNILQLQRDLMLMKAETRARQEVRRLAFGAGAAILGLLAVIFTLFWISHALYDAGWPPGVLALVFLLGLGVPAGVCAKIALEKKEGSPS